jgi:hypothetical protein
MQNQKETTMYHNIEVSKFHRGQYRGCGGGDVWAIKRAEHPSKFWLNEPAKLYWVAIRQKSRGFNETHSITGDSLREISEKLAALPVHA